MVQSTAQPAVGTRAVTIDNLKVDILQVKSRLSSLVPSSEPEVVASPLEDNEDDSSLVVEAEVHQTDPNNISVASVEELISSINSASIPQASPSAATSPANLN